MTIHLNHTIVSAKDRDSSAQFLSEILGLPTPETVGPFAIVQIGETSLDFIETDEEIQPQHYAFLVNEAEFDSIFERIKGRDLSYWADPSRRKKGEINTWDGGRGESQPTLRRSSRCLRRSMVSRWTRSPTSSISPRAIPSSIAWI